MLVGMLHWFHAAFLWAVAWGAFGSAALPVMGAAAQIWGVDDGVRISLNDYGSISPRRMPREKLWAFYHGNLKRWRDPSLAAALGGKQVLNGDALLIYPGEFVGLYQPIPSISLKMLRRGSQDYEYLWLAARATGDPAATDEIANRVLFRAMHEALKPSQDDGPPGERDSRSHDPEQWDAARRRLADRIMNATKT